jgi:hypothetical protein
MGCKKPLEDTFNLKGEYKMNTQENKTEPCYMLNDEGKYITTDFTFMDKKFEVKQRRLNGEEKQKYVNKLQSVYANKDVYKTLVLQESLKEQLEKLKADARRKGEDENAVIVPIDDETNYLIHTGTLAITKSNRENEASLIAYSTNDSFLDEGYFKVDGKTFTFEKRMAIIAELGEDEENDINWFKLLLGNANKLMTPTKREVEVAKS